MTPPHRRHHHPHRRSHRHHHPLGHQQDCRTTNPTHRLHSTHTPRRRPHRRPHPLPPTRRRIPRPRPRRTQQRRRMIDRKLAQEIVVTSTPGKRYSLTIDGQEFPWWIDASGVNLQVNDDEVPGVTIRIIANSVRVEHRID